MLPSTSEVEQRSESNSWMSGLMTGAGCAGEKVLWAVERQREGGRGDLVIWCWAAEVVGGAA